PERGRLAATELPDECVVDVPLGGGERRALPASHHLRGRAAHPPAPRCRPVQEPLRPASLPADAPHRPGDEHRGHDEQREEEQEDHRLVHPHPPGSTATWVGATPTVTVSGTAASSGRPASRRTAAWPSGSVTSSSRSPRRTRHPCTATGAPSPSTSTTSARGPRATRRLSPGTA